MGGGGAEGAGKGVKRGRGIREERRGGEEQSELSIGEPGQ